MKKCISDLKDSELNGKRVLVRVDFNVPQDKAGNITDDRRIRESLPTIKYLIDKGSKVILVSHLGRPSGVTQELRMNPIAKRLEELLGKKVLKLDDCIGEEVEDAVSKMNNGDVTLLENVRFYKEEEANDENFSKKLAALADVYVNDAFGTAHRAHASTEGVAHILPGVCGFLIRKELEFLGGALTNPKKPFVAIIGGAKVSSKITVIKNLAQKVDTLVIGGGMIFTFMKTQGFEIGKSLVETKFLDQAKVIWSQLKGMPNLKLIVPVDHVVVAELKADAPSKVVPNDGIPADMLGVDIGPETIKLIKDEIKNAGTVVWNGPMGVFEIDKFAKGTNEVARALADSKAVTIVGGGDSAAAVEKAGVADKITHISTGGGASLEFLEGKILPGIAILQDK
ncbi:MAG: phosphoglycerate kinase [Candidatus Saganbacteria bacterium]|nr:phosphoglycerate kinase [Candidatus Saganbacteria bacterium]